MRHGGTGVAAIFLLAASSQGMAEDCAAPCLAYAISIEIQDDWIYQASLADAESNELQPTIDSEFSLAPIDHLKLVAAITTEPVLDPALGESQAFEDIGTYGEQLYAEIDYDPARLRVGKIKPDFGLATHRLDGIYATDLVGDYDNEERWGLEGVLHFEAMGLSHALTASAFTTDRTFLSESLFTNRGRLQLSDGEAGNARGIASLVAVLDGCKGAKPHDCFADGRFGYRLAIRHQEAGHPTQEQIEEEITPQDETGYLAAATTRFGIEETAVRLLGELAYFEHFDGEPDDAWYATGSVSIEPDSLIFMLTYTRKRNLIIDGPDTTEHLVDVTAAYDLGEDFSLAGENWLLAAAYRYREDSDGETDHMIGFRITIDIEGAVPLAAVADH